jgi:hypothetical protein
MNTLLLLIVTAGITECAYRVPFKAMSARLLGVLPRAMRAIRSATASDHWKEKALLKLAKLSLISSLCVSGAIFGLVAVFLGGVYLLSLISPPLWPFAMSIEGITIVSVFAILYLIGRVYAESRLQRS